MADPATPASKLMRDFTLRGVILGALLTAGAAGRFVERAAISQFVER